MTSLKHYPYVASSDFHKPKHLYSWKTLLRCEKTWEVIARTLRTNVDIALTLYRNGRIEAALRSTIENMARGLPETERHLGSRP